MLFHVLKSEAGVSISGGMEIAYISHRESGYRRRGYMKKSNIVSFIVLICLIVLPVSAYALPISGVGELGGSFSGSIEYFPGNGLASTIDAAQGSLVVSLTNTSERRGLYLAAVSLASPYIPYIEARSEAFLDVGQTAWFYFSVTDRGFARLTAESFLSEGSEFVVYFRDASGAWDRARVASVPEPETILLLGIGLLALGVGLRKKTL